MIKKRPDDVLAVYVPSLPAKLDVDACHDLTQQLLLSNVGERLTSLAGHEVKREVLEESTVSYDGLVIRLSVRKGVFFHCGAELTADDVIFMLERVIANKSSASGLHCHLEKSGIRRASRYRVELRLKHRVPDFLARMALNEMTLTHRKSGSHCGLWQLVERHHDHWLLALNERHPLAPICHYRKVRIAPYCRKDEFNHHLADHAYVFVYPDVELKSPSRESLVDELCRELPAGMSCLLKLRDGLPNQALIKDLFAQACQKAMRPSRYWHRRPLLALFPAHHKLHVPFAFDRNLVAGKPLSLTIRDAAHRLSPNLRQKLAKAAESIGLNLCFLGEDGDADGELCGVLIPHPSDIYTPLAAFPHDEACAEQRGDGVPLRSEAQLGQWAKNLIQKHPYAPCLYTPIMVRSNRTLTPAEGSGLINFWQVRPSYEYRRHVQLEESALRAIGAAVQMFAHDVKKPLSMLQSVLSLLEATDDLARMRHLLEVYAPQVKRSIRTANILVQDIVDIGADGEPYREPVSLKELIDTVLRDFFALPLEAAIRFGYDFGHEHKVDVDYHKVSRLVQNVLANAVQAMQGDGVIWFASREASDGWLTVTLGNSGSYVPPDEVEGLFDRFFTKGKKQGTGLGLAIVKKIVTDHGGVVWCTSDREEGTAFHFTLPVCEILDDFGEELPTRAADLVPVSPKSVATGRGNDHGSRNYRVLVVDDDPDYLALMSDVFKSAEPSLVVQTVRTDIEALQAVTEFAPELILVDVELGARSRSGIELVGSLRSGGARDCRICVHSNGEPFHLQRRAIDAGADLFLPKPLTKEHVSSLIAGLARVWSRPTSGAKDRQRIAVIDDDALFLESWEQLTEYEWHTYLSPEEFWRAVDDKPDYLAGIAAVIADFSFRNSTRTGEELLAALEQRGFRGAILMATDRPADGSGRFTQLPKDAAQSKAVLDKLLNEAN